MNKLLASLLFLGYFATLSLAFPAESQVQSFQPSARQTSENLDETQLSQVNADELAQEQSPTGIEGGDDLTRDKRQYYGGRGYGGHRGYYGGHRGYYGGHRGGFYGGRGYYGYPSYGGYGGGYYGGYRGYGYGRGYYGGGYW